MRLTFRSVLPRVTVSITAPCERCRTSLHRAVRAGDDLTRPRKAATRSREVPGGVDGDRPPLTWTRTLVLLDDAAHHDAVAAEVAALVDAGEMACRVVAADEDVWQALRRLLTGERLRRRGARLVVVARSRVSRDVARAVGLPVLWMPVSAGCRADPPDEGQPDLEIRWSGVGYRCRTRQLRRHRMATRNSGPDALRAALDALLHDGEPPTAVPGNIWASWRRSATSGSFPRAVLGAVCRRRRSRRRARAGGASGARLVDRRSGVDERRAGAHRPARRHPRPVGARAVPRDTVGPRRSRPGLRLRGSGHRHQRDRHRNRGTQTHVRARERALCRCVDGAGLRGRSHHRSAHRARARRGRSHVLGTAMRAH